MYMMPKDQPVKFYIWRYWLSANELFSLRVLPVSADRRLLSQTESHPFLLECHQSRMLFLSVGHHQLETLPSLINSILHRASIPKRRNLGSIQKSKGNQVGRGAASFRRQQQQHMENWANMFFGMGHNEQLSHKALFHVAPFSTISMEQMYQWLLALLL